jgi:hypothetical protein
MRALDRGRASGGGNPGDKRTRFFRTFERVHGDRPNGLGLRRFTAERTASFLGRQVRSFRSWVVARGLALSVAWLHAAPRPLLFHADDIRRLDPRDGVDVSDFIGEVLAAWIITLLAVAIGVLLLAFHELDADDRSVPRWYDPPVADAGEWPDDLLVRRGADLMPPVSQQHRPRCAVKALVTTHSGTDTGQMLSDTKPISLARTRRRRLAYIDDFDLLMIAMLAALPLLIVFKKPASGRADHPLGGRVMVTDSA